MRGRIDFVNSFMSCGCMYGVSEVCEGVKGGDEACLYDEAVAMWAP